MFSVQLREARRAAGMSVADLAALSGTSRAAISDYELGVKRPRIDTAERVLEALGRTLTDVAVPAVPKRWRSAVEKSAVRDIAKWSADAAWVVLEASQMLPSVLESYARAERLELSWGQLRAIAVGKTVRGDPLDVRRAQMIAASARSAIQGAKRQQVPRLRTVVGDTLVAADPTFPPIQRELDFYTRAVAQGGDPALLLCTVNQAMLLHGVPWLFPPYKELDRYRRALVVAGDFGDPKPLVQVLTESLTERRFAQ